MDLNRQGRKEQELRLAAAKGNLGMVNVSLQSGVDANAIDDEGRTALIVAA